MSISRRRVVARWEYIFKQLSVGFRVQRNNDQTNDPWTETKFNNQKCKTSSIYCTYRGNRQVWCSIEVYKRQPRHRSKRSPVPGNVMAPSWFADLLNKETPSPPFLSFKPLVLRSHPSPRHPEFPLTTILHEHAH